MTKKVYTENELDNMGWEKEAEILNEAVECGVLSPSDWNDGNFDIVEVVEDLGYKVIG